MSRQDVVNQFAVHVGQADVAAAETEGQPLMIQTELMENGGVYVVDRGGVVDHRVAEVVGAAVGQARLESTSGNEDGVAVDVMIAADRVVDLGRVRGAAHFAGPQDDGGF